MAAGNDKHIAFNGCLVKCSLKTLESAGFSEYEEMIITQDIDIQKNKKFK